MRARRLLGAAAIGAGLLLSATGCGLSHAASPPLSHGAITAMNYLPGHSYTRLRPIYATRCRRSHHHSTCRRSVVRRIVTRGWNPDCWQLLLKQGNRTGAVCVDSYDYHRLRVGGRW